MPVYWFALSKVPQIQITDSILVFLILHVLVYPASNGYNSYMDRDEGSIGGIKNPLQPTRQLFITTLFMDFAAILLSLIISVYFSLGIFFYIAASRAYSFRGLRLKKYPILGYITVIVFQGAVTFALVYHGCSVNKSTGIPVIPMIASSLLIGGFYPLTQVYQHEADIKDGVKTISYLLGYRGTFIYCGIIYFIAFLLLGKYFYSSQQQKQFFIIATCMLPIIVYFTIWASKVWKDVSNANYENMMRINLIASLCTNLGFIIVLIYNHIE
ncbi:MAG: prenyltransferase [Bacteroidetes bacterium]|nr:MAG: prenyltransferase [Bacteroidota bacterium]